MEDKDDVNVPKGRRLGGEVIPNGRDALTTIESAQVRDDPTQGVEDRRPRGPVVHAAAEPHEWRRIAQDFARSLQRGAPGLLRRTPPLGHDKQWVPPEHPCPGVRTPSPRPPPTP